jgi:hypothetical protein
LERAYELRVSVGDTTIGLRAWDDAFAQTVDSWCAAFRSMDQPDFWLEIELRDGRSAAEIRSLVPQVRIEANGCCFRSCPPLWEGEISWSDHWLKFRTERELFHPSIQPRFLNVLLSSIYNTVCEYQGEEEREAFIFHGCGVAVGERGYLFTGPSGVGKTTVAGLAGQRTVLNDEAVLLRNGEEGVWLNGTPLLGGVKRRANAWRSLRAVLMLEQSEEVMVRPLQRGEAYSRFLAQLFDTSPLFRPGVDRERMSFLQPRADLAAAVVKSVPMYELHFRPDSSFWPLVEEL